MAALSPHDEPFASRLEALYRKLGDNYSRTTLAQVLAYRRDAAQPLPRSLAYRQSKVALGAAVLRMNSYLGYGVFGEGNIGNYEPIHFHDLEPLGFPIRLHGDAHSIACTFLLQQYHYRQGNANVRVKEGDTVIDAGAFVGDTALYLAQLAGTGGHVHAFEAHPYSLGIFRENLSINPQLADRVEVVEHVIWRQGGVKFALMGDLNNAHLTRPVEGRSPAALATSLSLDDYAAERRLDRLDFIKMDIEGAELAALQGAEQVLRGYRPRLAIAVYHRPADLVEIPEYLDSLKLGYQFYLDHFTDRGFETILFAESSHAGHQG